MALFIAVIGFSIAFLQYDSILKSEKAETTEVLSLIQKNLQYAFREVNSVALLLSQTINESGAVEKFDEVAFELMGQYPTVNLLEIIQDNIVREIYPFEEFNNIIGYNMEQNARVMNELLTAYERDALYVSGPVRLVEGKLGLIGLLPVHNNGGKITAVAVIMYLDTILEEAQIDAFSDNYDFLLYKYNNFDGTTDIYLDDAGKSNDLNQYESIAVEETDWTLYAKKKNQNLALHNFIIIGFCTTVVSIICGYLSYKLFRKPLDLQELLDEKSHDLIHSREKFINHSKLLNSILQSPEYIYIFSLDTDYNYLAYNKTYEHAVNKQFGVEIGLGDNMSKLLPELVTTNLYSYLDRAMQGEAFEAIIESKTEGSKLNYWQYWFSPIKDNGGKVTGITVFSVDISERKKAEVLIKKSLAEKTTLLSEIHHRVKNNLAIVSGLLQLQKTEVNDNRLSTIFDQSINRIISIAMVHELMYSTKDLSSINVHDYLEKLIPAISATMQNRVQDVDFDIEVQDYRLNINEAIPLGLLLNELITNSFKYAFKDRKDNRISVHLIVNNQHIRVFYTDNGVGYPEHIDFKTPKNLGLNLIHAQLQQLEAEYEVVTNGKFELEFSFDSQNVDVFTGVEV